MHSDPVVRYVSLAAAIFVVIVLLWNQQFFLSAVLAILLLLAEQLPRLKNLTLSKGKISLSLIDKLGPDVAKLLEDKIAKVISNYEKKEKRTVPEETKRAIDAIMVEGFTKRLDELQERSGYALDSMEGRLKAVEQAVSATQQLLESGDKKKNQVTVAEMNRSVRANFCKVWPFC